MTMLNIVPITREAFSPFGQLIDRKDADSFIINDGFATRHDKLAITDMGDGVAQISIFDASIRPYPLDINMMERHPIASQAFYPLSNHAWYAIVCASETPSHGDLRAFVIPGDVGVQYHKNIWHYPLLIQQERQSFLVVDYCGDTKNIDLYHQNKMAIFAP
jgi:ureidoglycolate lyase